MREDGVVGGLRVGVVRSGIGVLRSQWCMVDRALPRLRRGGDTRRVLCVRVQRLRTAVAVTYYMQYVYCFSLSRREELG